MNAPHPISTFAVEGEVLIAERHVRSMTAEQRRAAWVEDPDDDLFSRDHAARHFASLSPAHQAQLNSEWDV